MSSAKNFRASGAIVPFKGHFHATFVKADRTISKSFKLQNDGSLDKQVHAGALTQAKFTTLKLVAKAFIDLLKNSTASQCIIFGLCKVRSASQIRTKAWVEAQEQASADIVARTREYFEWPDGEAVMSIDFDPTDDIQLNKVQLLDALYRICPAARFALHFWAASTSSYIKNTKTGVWVHELRGQRIYLVFSSGKDMRRAAEVFHKRAWLAGFGWIKISKAGRQLERSIIDLAVVYPEHVDYVASECKAPLQQVKPPPEVHGDPRFILDSSVALPDLTHAESVEFARLVSEQLDKTKLQADSVAKQYRRDTVKGYVDRGMTQEAAQRIVDSAFEGSLLPEFELMGEDGVTVTVAQLLASPSQYHEKRFCDPLEPDYHGDNRVAVALLSGSRPRIYSHAHGGCHYFLTQGQTLLANASRAILVPQLVRILKTNQRFFQRAGALVEVMNSGTASPATDMNVLRALDESVILQEQVPGAPPAVKEVKPAHAQLIVAAYANNFDELAAVSTAPLVEPVTGRYIDNNGYDADSEIFFMLPELTSHPVASPSMAQVQRALQIVWWPLRFFPFAAPVDNAVMLAAMLTAVSRPALQTAPAFAFDAPLQGTGKSLLVRVLAAVMGAVPGMLPPRHKDDDEMSKQLISAFQSNNRLIALDNIVGDFDSPPLAIALTNDTFSGRPLYTNKIVHCRTNALVVLTGNNISVTGDMARRVFKARIDAKSEQPHTRSFPFNPEEMVIEHREAIVAALNTLTLGYYASVSSKQDGAVASFEQWDLHVRRVVLWLAELQAKGVIKTGLEILDGVELITPELADPADSIREAVSTDPLIEQLQRCTAAMLNCFGTGIWLSVAKMQEAMAAKKRMGDISSQSNVIALENVFREIAHDRSGDINTTRLGKFLGSKVDRPVDGLVLRKRPAGQGVFAYSVERV